MGNFGRNEFGMTIPQINEVTDDNVLISKDGNQYIDLMCGTSCVGFGTAVNSNPVLEIIFEKAKKCFLNTYDYDTIYKKRMEASLEKIHPEYKFSLFSGGCECTEGAIRVARQLAKNKYNKEGKFASFTGCFHGKSDFVNLLTENIETEKTTSLKYNDVYGLNIPDDVIAVIIEPFQCRNGVNIASQDFIDKLILQCKQKNVLIIADEISCAIRGGEFRISKDMFKDYTPDIVLFGKNYGQGIPVTLLGIRKDLKDDFSASLTSGYGSNSLACLAVTEVVEYILRNNSLQEIRAKGNKFLEKLKSLEELEWVDSVLGKGMWFSVILNEKISAKVIAQGLLKKGFIVGIVGNRIRLAPDFYLESEYWDEFIYVFKELI